MTFWETSTVLIKTKVYIDKIPWFWCTGHKKIFKSPPCLSPSLSLTHVLMHTHTQTLMHAFTVWSSRPKGRRNFNGLCVSPSDMCIPEDEDYGEQVFQYLSYFIQILKVKLNSIKHSVGIFHHNSKRLLYLRFLNTSWVKQIYFEI